MLNNMTGTRFRLVSGYPGTREITLAIEKNEVKGLCGFSWSSLQAQRPDWIKSGFIRVLVQEHDKGHPDISRMGVPLAVEFAKTPEHRRVMELIYSSETFGRPYMMRRPACRRSGSRPCGWHSWPRCAIRNCWRRQRRSGSSSIRSRARSLQALAENIFATPAAVVEQAKQALEYRAP